MKSRVWQVIRPLKRSLVRATMRPRVGMVDWGDLRRSKPIGRDFGVDRGTPVDRHYIDGFLAEHRDDVRGYVMEVGTDAYTRRLGQDRVTANEITHNTTGHPSATMIVDLTQPPDQAESRFDCIICTQTLHLIFETSVAMENLYRLLNPGGVLLLTSAGISQISRVDMRATGDYWRFTEASMRRLVGEFFPLEHCTVKAYGNVLGCVAFLHGIAAEELSAEDLDAYDPEYQMLIAARAVKAG